MKLYVDAWWSMQWPFQIRGVLNNQQVFYESFSEWWNNIGEYVALYYWLFMYPDAEVYTDSEAAIRWAVKWKAKYKNIKDKRVRQILRKADIFFAWWHDLFRRIKYWHTKTMWENPADFGRKKFHLLDCNPL